MESPQNLTPSQTLESTLTLLELIREGDEEARDRLIRRVVVPLQRWARGRLPQYLRPVWDTGDLVQEAVFKALSKIEGFRSEFDGALLAYLRRTVSNEIHDLARRHQRRPRREPIEYEIPDPGPSPMETVIGRRELQRFEAAMGRLDEKDQAAIVARIELGLPFREVALELGKPTEDAARMAVRRALVRLAKEMATLKKAGGRR